MFDMDILVANAKKYSKQKALDLAISQSQRQITEEEKAKFELSDVGAHHCKKVESKEYGTFYSLCDSNATDAVPVWLIDLSQSRRGVK